MEDGQDSASEKRAYSSEKLPDKGLGLGPSTSGFRASTACLNINSVN